MESANSIYQFVFSKTYSLFYDIFFLKLWAFNIPGFTARLRGDWVLNLCERWNCHPSIFTGLAAD